MTKKVTFNAKDVFGKTQTIMDTWNNVQIVQKGLDRIYKAMDKVDAENVKKRQEIVKKAREGGATDDEIKQLSLPEVSFLDYANVIDPIVVDEVETLLGLTTKADKEKFNNLSYSDIEDFYAKVCKDFANIDLPSISHMQKAAERMQKIAAGQASFDDDEEAVDPK